MKTCLLQTLWKCACGSGVFLLVAASGFAQAPVILTQPQSQEVLVGTNVTLSVGVVGFASSFLPPVDSGTLQLWLKADAGVVTNSSGQVSLWQDQSGNANDASQASANEQPSLVYPPAIGGRAALRFNGIEDGVNGDYLHGTGNVGVSNAMTAFAVYDAFNTTNSFNSVWYVGVPGTVYGASRGYTIYHGQMDFTMWAYDSLTPWEVPTNTYRICTDRVNANLSQVQIYDNSATDSTNFTEPMSGALTPQAGYYVGGLNTALQFVNPVNLDGDVAELAIYNGYLSDADRLAVLGYLEQKYFQTGDTNGFGLQWQLDGTNIAGATNSTLLLADIQTNESGAYSVVVSNIGGGSATSSNAVLLVGTSPSITVQPQSLEVVQGTNVTFMASVTGSGPLGFQWSLNGTTLAQATNSVLSLSNVQTVNAGTYTVSVTSPFGEALSSNAVLTIDLLPVIAVQPQSQAVIVGSNVTFSVSEAPAVASGTLQLWLRADAGVSTNASGMVSEWKDQSGNTNDALQSSTNNQPLLVNPSEIFGQPAIRFNGIQDGVNGNYLHGTGNLGVSNAITAFVVYNTFNNQSAFSSVWFIGVPGAYGASRGYTIYHGQLDFTTWGDDYVAPWVVPSNTYRICTDRVNTNLSEVQLFDNSSTSQTNFSQSMSGGSTPAPGYSVGGLNPLFGGGGYTLTGDVAELIIYKGDLTDADRLAVLGYLQQKYFQTGEASTADFQWQFDGTNIAGATNATLTLTNVQAAEAGTYTVTLIDADGSTTSSNAVLTTLSPPTITSSPASQSVVAGTTVTFNAAATGTGPVAYQWQFDGTNILGATNASLTVTNALIANAGSYAMTAANSYGSATSSVATLSVDESTIQVVSTSATGGGSVVVSIDLIALGTESGLGFTLDFDPSVLTYTGAVLGSGASGGAPEVNTSQVASGRLGLGAAMFSGTFSGGTNDVFDVTFQVAVVTNAVTTSLAFSSLPTGEQVSDPIPQALPAVYLPGVVVVSPTALEGDVSPRPNCNEVLDITDWIQEGRFVAGLDIVSNGGEFQRADCAPRGTLGDGQITVADWVQVGRYAVGLDPLTAAGGPTAPVSQTSDLRQPSKSDLSHSLTLVPLSQGAAMSSVAVELAAQGDESALQFSVTFNPALIRFVNASLGNGAPAVGLIQNTNMAANGNLGFVVGMLPPATFPAGTLQLVKLNFAPISFSNTTALVFGGTPIPCQLVDSNTAVLSTSYQNSALTVGGLVWPTLSITQSGNNAVLSWPSSATGFQLQASAALDGGWSDVDATPATNGTSVFLTSPISTNAVYYRLKY